LLQHLLLPHNLEIAPLHRSEENASSRAFSNCCDSPQALDPSDVNSVLLCLFVS